MTAVIGSVVLAGGAIAGGALAASPTGTPSATERAVHLKSPIQHVVFIYRENHSFDNMFAIYCVHTHKCDGRTGTVRLTNGPHLTQRATDISPEICHEVRCMVTAVNNGRMDGFDRIRGCFANSKVPYGCLQQYRPEQIPTATWMANHGVIADRFFSELNPSAGAHMFVFTGEDKLGFIGNNPGYLPTGYPEGPGWGCDSNKKGDWVDPLTTQHGRQFFCNPNAQWLPNGGAAGPTKVRAAPDFFTSILDPNGISWLNYGGVPAWNLPPYHAKALAKDRHKMVPESRILKDARAGRLPNVSFVTPQYYTPDVERATSQHPQTSTAVGDNFINDVLAAVRAGSQASSTAVILTYDDCGCFYDHVAPPRGLGVRVPLLIWSPWAKAGTVDHKPAQFASILAFIEHNFRLPSLTTLNPRAQDGRVTNDLMGNFDFTKRAAASAPPLPPTQVIPAAEVAWLRAHPPADEDT
jgi:phospholipase C